MRYCKEMFLGKTLKSSEVVSFFRPYERYGVFSQWFIQWFEDDGNEFNCMEQYMMYHKAVMFKSWTVADAILNAKDPAEIKRLGREVRNFVDSEWDNVKQDIVVSGNMLKFSQNESAKVELLATGDSVLVEASPYDKIWGIGIDRRDIRRYTPDLWPGQNLLGFSLMEVRDKLR